MKLAEQWVHHILDVNNGIETGSDKDLYFDATIVLDGLCRKKLGDAWIVITEIFEGHSDKEIVMDNLAAGPLEDLLTYHGAEAINLIKKYCDIHNSFKDILSGVWRNNMDLSVWEELQGLMALKHE